MTDTRTRAVQTLTERLGLDLAEANEIIVCLLAETITEAETRTRAADVQFLRDHAFRYPPGNVHRDALLGHAYLLEHQPEQP